MSRTLAAAPVLLAALLLTSHAGAAVVVPWALRMTVDTDGDTVPDIVDNAPGVANNQADADADLIGDVIDPTPMLSNPALGSLVIGIPPLPSILAGSNGVIDYLMVSLIPPGGFGYVDLDFGGDNVYDATYFGPLTASLDQIVIPPSLFVSGTWDLYTPGTYQFQALAFAPGGTHANAGPTFSSIVVEAPEPASLTIVVVAAATLLRRRRASR